MQFFFIKPSQVCTSNPSNSVQKQHYTDDATHFINIFEYLVLCIDIQIHDIKINIYINEILMRTNNFNIMTSFMALHICVTALVITLSYNPHLLILCRDAGGWRPSCCSPPTSFTNQIFLSALWVESGAFNHVNLT